MSEAPKVVACFNHKTNGPHSRQIFAGLSVLARQGVIALELRHEDWNPRYRTENLLRVTVDNSRILLFDTNDGFYWMHGSLEDNIDYFRREVLPSVHCVYKRSCNPEIIRRFGPQSEKFRPLGLNFEVTNRHNAIDHIYFGWRNRLRKQARRSRLLCRILGRTSDDCFQGERFEFAPSLREASTLPRILLLTRLWDPGGEDMGPTDAEVRKAGAEARNHINRTRIAAIEACRQAFGSRFVGGLAASTLAERMAPHLIAPSSMTRKETFLDLVKSAPICIATTGLHHSTGWRMAEYVAASRAIVSERIHDLLPGQFESRRNYLQFSAAEDLVLAIQELSDDKKLLSTMMWNNYCYYRLYGRPECIVLNALRDALSRPSLA